MKLFFSYARPDGARADSLAQRLRQAGNEVWLDTELTGGQVWWDKILDQVRRCDALVVIVSWASIKSQACMHERAYATRLGKAVLPVAVEQIRAEVLPSDIGRLQVIDYSEPSETAAFQLIGSIMKLPPPPPLPDPMPEPPSIPISYLAAISDRLSKPDLSRDDQFAIVGILEEALGSSDESDRISALQLLTEMEGRNDLLAAVYRRIATLKGTAHTTGTGQGSGSAPGQGNASGPGPAPGQGNAPGPGSAAGAGTGSWWRDLPGSDRTGGASTSTGPAPGAQDRGGQSSPSRATPPKREWRLSAQQQQQWQPSSPKSQSPPPPQQPRRQPPPRPQPPPPPQPPPSSPGRPTVLPVSQVIVAISPHWAMAVWSVIFFWPLGIFAVISAARVKPSVASGDLAAAQKASSRVKTMFWISIALAVVFYIILAASVANTNTNNQY